MVINQGFGPILLRKYLVLYMMVCNKDMGLKALYVCPCVRCLCALYSSYTYDPPGGAVNESGGLVSTLISNKASQCVYALVLLILARSRSPPTHPPTVSMCISLFSSFVLYSLFSISSTYNDTTFHDY